MRLFWLVFAIHIHHYVGQTRQSLIEWPIYWPFNNKSSSSITFVFPLWVYLSKSNTLTYLLEQTRSPCPARRLDNLDVTDVRLNSRRNSLVSPLARLSSLDPVDIQKKLAPMLEGMSGEERISRKSVYRRSSEISEPSISALENNLSTIFEPLQSRSRESSLSPQNLEPHRKVKFEDEQSLSPPISPHHDATNQYVLIFSHSWRGAKSDVNLNLFSCIFFTQIFDFFLLVSINSLIFLNQVLRPLTFP